MFYVQIPPENGHETQMFSMKVDAFDTITTQEGDKWRQEHINEAHISVLKMEHKIFRSFFGRGVVGPPGYRCSSLSPLYLLFDMCTREMA